MYYILLSGGSGKRLWPLSNDIQSKQFIKLLKKRDGTYESMLQRIYSQISSIDSNAKFLIATTKSQVPLIKNQLGKNIKISIEPSRNDTFSAIILSSFFLKEKFNVKSDEIITICPIDSYVNISYFKKILNLQKIIKNTDTNIGLIGINPSYPSSKYGYIIPKNTNNNFYKVKQFIEKPSEKKAKDLIKIGALWNGGVFCFKLKYILDKAFQITHFNNYKDLYDNYNKIEKISFDYKIIEKEKNLIMVKYNGDWKDIGTWNTFTNVMHKDNIGNVIIDKKSTNTNIINVLDVPVIAMGLKNIIVASSYDGIFVSDKNESSYNKKLVEKINNIPMYAEKDWGNFKILELNSSSLTKHIKIYKGKYISYQKHKHRDEVWIITSGSGIFILNGVKKIVHPGDTLIIKKGQKHTVKAIEELHFIEVQIGDFLSEDDIERFSFSF